MAGYNYQSTAGNTARFQKQNIPESQMTPKWYMQCVRAIATHYNSTTFDEFAFDKKPYVHKFLEHYTLYHIFLLGDYIKLFQLFYLLFYQLL